MWRTKAASAGVAFEPDGGAAFGFAEDDPPHAPSTSVPRARAGTRRRKTVMAPVCAGTETYLAPLVWWGGIPGRAGGRGAARRAGGGLGPRGALGIWATKNTKSGTFGRPDPPQRTSTARKSARRRKAPRAAPQEDASVLIEGYEVHPVDGPDGGAGDDEQGKRYGQGRGEHTGSEERRVATKATAATVSRALLWPRLMRRSAILPPASTPMMELRAMKTKRTLASDWPTP